MREVTLRVEAGTTTALLGRSGSGKTTLLRMVNGLVTPTSGQVVVGGVAVAAAMAGDVGAFRRGIGYVIQETGLFPHWTVKRNGGVSLERAGGWAKAALRERVAECLGLAGLDAGEFGERYLWQLSGGQRQRVGLARALAADPAVMLMDEPFGALDPLTRGEMQEMMREMLRRVGKTVLIVTHDLEEALFLAGRVVFLEAGEVVADLAAAEVMSSENRHVRGYVGAVRRRG